MCAHTHAHTRTKSINLSINQEGGAGTVQNKKNFVKKENFCQKEFKTKNHFLKIIEEISGGCCGCRGGGGGGGGGSSGPK